MKKKKLALVAVILLAGLCCSEAFALSPMGAPTAGLSKGQFAIGADYSDSELSIDFDLSSGAGADFTKDNFRIDTIAGKLGYGITDSWEASLNIGAADAVSSQNMERHSADGMSYGIGTKVTLHENEKLGLGGLFQARWAELDGDASGPGWSGDLEIDIMQLQLAVGPTYELMDSLSIYGGPFWYYLDGEKRYEEPGSSEKYDMSNTSDFGIYIGALVNLCENADLNIEYQLTDDDDVFGLGILCKF